MNISWLLGPLASDHAGQIDKIKNTELPIWGSQSTWRRFETDNVICHELDKAVELVKRDFQNACNLYVPESNYTSLNNPDNVRLYNGEFDGDMDHKEEVIAAHLVASTADVVLMLGFDLKVGINHEDQFAKHKHVAFLRAIKTTIWNNKQTQWVLVDSLTKPDREFTKFTNFTCDTMDNVLQLV